MAKTRDKTGTSRRSPRPAGRPGGTGTSRRSRVRRAGRAGHGLAKIARVFDTLAMMSSTNGHRDDQNEDDQAVDRRRGRGITEQVGQARRTITLAEADDLAPARRVDGLSCDVKQRRDSDHSARARVGELARQLVSRAGRVDGRAGR